MEEVRDVLNKIDSFIVVFRSFYRALKTPFIVVAIFLIPANYIICDYFYFKDGVFQSLEWWRLKHSLYCLSIALLFQSYSIGSKKWNRFLLQVGTCFAATNIIEVYNNTKLEFNEQDFRNMFMIIVIASVDGLYNNYKDAVQ